MIRQFFRENIQLIRKGKNFLRFELLHKLVALAAVVPTGLVLLNLSIHLAGLAYLTNDNIYRYLQSPFGLLCALGLLVLYAVYSFWEISAQGVFFYAGRGGMGLTVTQMSRFALSHTKRLFYWRNTGMFLYIALIVPLTLLPLVAGYAGTVQLPDFILQYILARKWLAWIGLLLLAGMFFLSVRWVFTIHYFVLENQPFRKALKSSAALVRGRAGRTVLLLVCWNGAVLFFLFGGYLLFIGAALLISKAFIPGTAAMKSFLFLFRWLNLGLLLGGSCIALPFSGLAVSGMFFRFKKEKKEAFVPLRKLAIPKRLKGKRRGWGMAAAVLAALAVLNLSYIRPSLYRGTFGSFESLNKPLITSHRGDSVHSPENTMAAFRTAVENKADMIELDLQQLADGTIIVMHDSNFLRTAGVDRQVWEATAEEVAEMEAGSWFSEKFSGEPIPTLAEILSFAKTAAVRLNIELKATGHEQGLEEEVIRLIREANFENRCVITSLQYSVLQRVKALAPELMTGYVLSVAYGPFYDMEDVDIFSVRADFITPAMVRALHNRGKRIMAWTVNGEDQIRQMLDWRVDNIITDDPALARSIVDVPGMNENLLRIFEEFFTGHHFSTTATRFWKAVFQP